MNYATAITFLMLSVAATADTTASFSVGDKVALAEGSLRGRLVSAETHAGVRTVPDVNKTPKDPKKEKKKVPKVSPKKKTVPPSVLYSLLSHVIADDSETCLSPGDYEDYDWYEMPTEAIEAAVALGYSQVSWDLSSVPASFFLPWSALSGIQRVASNTLGCDAQCWDRCYIDGSTIGGFDRSLFDDSECVARPFEDSYWDDMEEDTHEYLVVLGYSQIVWDMEGLSPKEDYLWTDLTSEEQAAGVGLGYNETSWFNCIN